MDCLTIVSTLLGIFLGGIITWFVSRFYYIRASNDLNKKANQLRELTELMLRGMEAAGWVEFNRDDKGNPVGIVFKGFFGEKGHIKDEVFTTVIPGPSEKEDT